MNFWYSVKQSVMKKLVLITIIAFSFISCDNIGSSSSQKYTPRIEQLKNMGIVVLAKRSHSYKLDKGMLDKAKLGNPFADYYFGRIFCTCELGINTSDFIYHQGQTAIVIDKKPPLKILKRECNTSISGAPLSDLKQDLPANIYNFIIKQEEIALDKIMEEGHSTGTSSLRYLFSDLDIYHSLIFKEVTPPSNSKPRFFKLDVDAMHKRMENYYPGKDTRSPRQKILDEWQSYPHDFDIYK